MSERDLIVKFIRRYGEINSEICSDGILLDPLLMGEAWTADNIAKSKECQITTTIHSAKYHACQELADSIERGDHLEGDH